MREFVRWADSIGFDGVEVSEGTVELGAGIKAGLIEAMARDFVVLAEVGSKDVEAPVRPSAWAAQMEADLAAGAAFVIAEGRESGTVGLYHPDGRVREPLVSALVARVPADRIIFEAPSPAQQQALRSQDACVTEARDLFKYPIKAESPVHGLKQTLEGLLTD